MFSVVIPVFNAEQHIYDTLKSLDNDLTQDDEIIIVDDHSTDRSLDIIHTFMEHSKCSCELVVLQTNSGGPAKPRNIGIENANNRWICFLDADDIWLPGRRDVLCSALQQGCEVVFSKIVEFKNTLTDPKQILVDQKIKRVYGFNLKLSNPLALSTSCIKTSLLKNLRFDETPELIAVEDFDLWLRLSRSSKIFISDQKTIGYRVHSKSLSSNKFKQGLKVINVYKKNTTIWPFWSLIYATRGTFGFVRRVLTL